MNLNNKNILSIFFFTLLLTIVGPNLLPTFRLYFFVPFLVILFYQKSLFNCLLLSFVCGLIIDLLSPNVHFGICSFNYCVTTFILYSQKKNFFADSLSTLPIMTFFYSVISTLIQVSLLHIFSNSIDISLPWIVTDVIIMPIVDAGYAFTVFILPFFLFGRKQRRGQDYFLSR